MLFYSIMVRIICRSMSALKLFFSIYPDAVWSILASRDVRRPLSCRLEIKVFAEASSISSPIAWKTCIRYSLRFICFFIIRISLVCCKSGCNNIVDLWRYASELFSEIISPEYRFSVSVREHLFNQTGYSIWYTHYFASFLFCWLYYTVKVKESQSQRKSNLKCWIWFRTIMWDFLSVF